jgi:hypothetical protein
MSWIRNTVIGLSGLGLVGAVVFGSNLATRDDTGEIIESGDIDVFSLQEGDCLEDLDFGSEDEDGVSEVTEGIGVPCSEPHVYEVFSQLFLNGLSQKEIQETSFDECLKDFESYVGVPFEESVLYITTLFPTLESYATGDREVSCLLVTEDETPVTGSARGSRK